MTFDRIILLPHFYYNMVETGGDSDFVVYVDKDNKHPDPLGKLIWGWDRDGNTVRGDFNRYFERCGRAIILTYDTTYCKTASQKQIKRNKTIVDYIESLKKEEH